MINLELFRICPVCGWVYTWHGPLTGDPVCSRHGINRGSRWAGRVRMKPATLRPPRLVIPTKAQLDALPIGVTLNEADSRSDYLTRVREARLGNPDASMDSGSNP